MRPPVEKIVEKQLNIWKERVWLPDVCPPKEEKDEKLVLVENDVYNKLFTGSKFSTVFTKDKEDIYRFLRYGIEKAKIYNSNIIFVRKSLFETYISPEGSMKESYDLCRELLKIIASNYEGKWIVCDSLDCDFNDKLAVYFLTHLQMDKAAGIVFSCNSKLPNNLYSCIKSSEIADIVEI